MQIDMTPSTSTTDRTMPTECSGTHICLCFDGNINKQVLLTAVSAATATQGALTVHFVCPQKAEQNFRSDLNALTARLHTQSPNLFTPEIHVIADETFDALPGICWLPKASCLRLIISSILPRYIQRVIYLDSDIMATADLSELYRVDMRGCPIAAVQDDGMRQYYCAPIGLDARHYFNAGVLLIDLTQWQEPAQRALDLFTENGAIYPTLDQDVLNIVFKNKWRELDARWNTTSQRQPFASRWFELIWPDGWKNERLPPAVYHMTPFKPWTVCNTSRYRFAYRNLARTLFDGGIKTIRGEPLSLHIIAWLPLPLYRLMRFLWDSHLMLKHCIRRIKRIRTAR